MKRKVIIFVFGIMIAVSAFAVTTLDKELDLIELPPHGEGAVWIMLLS